MKKFEKELLFLQVEGETTTGSGNGTTGENAGEGENDAPEQEPVDEGAENDNNMYDGQDGTSSGQTPDGQGNSSSEQTQDGQNSSSSGQNPEGQGADSGYGWEEDIPSVTIIGHPPVNNEEEPDEDEGDEYENNDVNEDDTQKSTEQSEEEKTENTTTEPTEEEIAAILSDFAEKHPRIIFDSSMTTEQKVAFINEFLKKIPSTMQTLEVTIKFNKAQKPGGQYDQGTITFKSLSGLNDSIIEEYIHANQHAIIGWEYMKQTRAETEFEAKMIDSLNYFAHHGFPNQDWIDITDGGKSLYEFIANCFGYTAMTAPVENNMNIWDEFNQSVFDDGFERLFELWIKMPKEDEKDQYTPNADYDWSLYWEELIHPFKYN